jgi:hypothetical protein
MVAAYAFQAAPRPVTDRPKYRETVRTSLASDPRVFRGSTVAVRTSTEEAKPTRHRTFHKPKEIEPRPFDIPLPPPERVPVDLDVHLLAPEVPVFVAQSESQTDVFLPEPPEPEYVPRKTGIDASTQIYAGDLFSFDVEVAPILDVLVTKTLEQALTEVDDEDELANVAKFKEEWGRRQRNLVADWEQTVKVERERAAEKERVLAAAKARKKRELALMTKLAAKRNAEQYLRGVTQAATKDLLKVGHFPEKLEGLLGQEFWPWVMQKVDEVHAEKLGAQNLLNATLNNAVAQVSKRGLAVATDLTQEVQKQKRRTAERNEALKGNIRIYLNTPTGAVVVGPIRISESEEIEAINERTFAWLEENHPEVAANTQHGVELYIGDTPTEKASELFRAAPGTISLKPKPAPPVAAEPVAEAPAPEAEGVAG